MSTDPTTRKLAAQLTRAALDVDRLTRQLATREDLTSEYVSGSMAILQDALDELTSALYIAEEVFDLRIRAEYFETARILAQPAPAAWTVSLSGGSLPSTTRVCHRDNK